MKHTWMTTSLMAVALAGCGSSQAARPMVNPTVVVAQAGANVPPHDEQAGETRPDGEGTSQTAPVYAYDAAYRQAVFACIQAHMQAPQALCGGGLSTDEVLVIRDEIGQIRGGWRKEPHLEFEAKYKRASGAIAVRLWPYYQGRGR